MGAYSSGGLNRAWGLNRGFTVCSVSRVGEHDWRETEGSEAEYVVSRVFKHPQYQYPSPINNDIAVFELERPIVFNKYVQPVCLPTGNVAAGTECYITGMLSFPSLTITL